ncbi:MAG: FAD-dependent oxidoreductase [Burkholderiales bacterium]|nr:FAD-dependent oxidoreductase [Burkholderiales bacterium]
MDRRRFCTLTSAATAAALAGCRQGDSPTTHITGSFTGIQRERGHWLRDGLRSGQPWPAPSKVFKTQVLIAGGGVAGLAAARALRLRGMDDFALLELEDTAGGNSRAGSIAGLPCPQGAHYLPLPGDDAPEVQDLLEELGLRRRVAGRWTYDERHLCHSPQERLFFHGEWQDGLLPLNGVGASTPEQYRRFATLVEQARKAAPWHMPVQNGSLALVQTALAAITFVAYLDQNGLTDSHLRWYLDYCCRDDYGAGITTVSAWAGIHYFASRHGFHAPGTEVVEREGLLTWPEGNAWLTRRLAAPLGERLHTGRVVLRIASGRHGVEVDAFNTATQTVERWQAEQAVVALPIFVAARMVQNPPDVLRFAARQVAYAPWLVANIHIASPLHDRPGPAPSWDNVLYGAAGDAVSGAMGLGYVDATHQGLQPVAGATVLTHYRALGDVAGAAADAAVGAAGRKLLLERPWSAWRDLIVAELSTAHPDLAAKATRLDITRYGHAMAIPRPKTNGQIGHWPSQMVRDVLSKSKHAPPRPLLAWQRLRFAHSDWAGYSVFEEAFTAGHSAGG